MPIPEGALVRVTDAALTDAQYFVRENKQIVEWGGYLYFVQRYDADEKQYDCRSLASGEEDIPFFEGEIEVFEEQADADT